MKTPYINHRIYGPYNRPDGRQHVITVSPDGIRKTVSYPRFLMEERLGRLLEKSEEVHHKNGDFNNNDVENLEVKNATLHRVLHQTKYETPIKVNCVWCREVIILSPRQQQHRTQNKSKLGPFCSKRCSGKYGAWVLQRKLCK